MAYLAMFVGCAPSYDRPATIQHCQSMIPTHLYSLEWYTL
jgi:hypothetical protein